MLFHAKKILIDGLRACLSVFLILMGLGLLTDSDSAMACDESQFLGAWQREMRIRGTDENGEVFVISRQVNTWTLEEGKAEYRQVVYDPDGEVGMVATGRYALVFEGLSGPSCLADVKLVTSEYKIKPFQKGYVDLLRGKCGVDDFEVGVERDLSNEDCGGQKFSDKVPYFTSLKIDKNLFVANLDEFGNFDCGGNASERCRNFPEQSYKPIESPEPIQ